MSPALTLTVAANGSRHAAVALQIMRWFSVAVWIAIGSVPPRNTALGVCEMQPAATCLRVLLQPRILGPLRDRPRCFRLHFGRRERLRCYMWWHGETQGSGGWLLGWSAGLPIESMTKCSNVEPPIGRSRARTSR